MGVFSNIFDLVKQNFTEKEDGPYEIFFSNGVLKSKVFIKDNKRNGPWNVYFKSGRMSEIGTWKDNNLHGDWCRFYDLGISGSIKREEGIFKNGKLDGVHTTYYKDGRIVQQRLYKNGKYIKRIK
jgi:antitoxin component YwqK of YwqJK toxin-antitoxin module